MSFDPTPFAGMTADDGAGRRVYIVNMPRFAGAACFMVAFTLIMFWLAVAFTLAFRAVALIALLSQPAMP